MNMASSRSHSLFVIAVSRTDKDGIVRSGTSRNLFGWATV
jgi:hypothetical protein